jgi:hypothetical protein
VSRSRFAPVKTTADLLLVRSDAYRLTEDYRIELIPERQGIPPKVDLDGKHYKMVDGLERLVQRSLPSLRHVESLVVKGPLQFAPGVILRGKVVLENPESQPCDVGPGLYGKNS